MSAADQMERFEGYAILELMGHRKAAGHVTTKYFGPTAIFEIVQQEIPPHEVVLPKPQRINYETVPAGSKIRISRERAVQYYAASSLYCLTPCSEEQANAFQPAKVEVIERAEGPAAIAAPGVMDIFEPADPDDEEDEDDVDPLEDHTDDVVMQTAGYTGI